MLFYRKDPYLKIQRLCTGTRFTVKLSISGLRSRPGTNPYVQVQVAKSYILVNIRILEGLIRQEDLTNSNYCIRHPHLINRF